MPSRNKHFYLPSFQCFTSSKLYSNWCPSPVVVLLHCLFYGMSRTECRFARSVALGYGTWDVTVLDWVYPVCQACFGLIRQPEFPQRAKMIVLSSDNSDINKNSPVFTAESSVTQLLATQMLLSRRFKPFFGAEFCGRIGIGLKGWELWWDIQAQVHYCLT